MKGPAVISRLLILLSIIALSVNGDVMMDDDAGDDADDHELTKNDTIEMISLNVSQYCFVDDNTIRINTTVLLNITDSSADVLLATLATDNTVIFTAPTNGSRCTDNDGHDKQLSITLYAIQMIIYSVTILAAIGNITLHLVVKDLHTVSGILVIILCVNVIIITVISMGTLTNTFVNNITVICVILVNLIFALLLVYQATKLTILCQFVYLMYHSYKLRYKQEENIKKRIFKYVIFIVGSSSVGYLLPVAIDLVVNGRIYSGMERYCLIDVEYTFLHVMLVYGEFAVFIVLQYITFAIGLTLYFLVANNCCMMKSTNFRVTMALIATVGINIVLLISLRKARIPFTILIPAVTIGTLAEQVILLVLFLSSNKVLLACRSACAKEMFMKKTARQSMMTVMTEQHSNMAEQV